MDEFASVQFVRLKEVSSAEGSPTVSLPVYITQSTFPGKEGELLLIPARRLSNYNEKIQGTKEHNSERNSAVEDNPEYHDCINSAKVNRSSSSDCISTSELNASVVDKLDENVVQNILNSSFTELAESDYSDEEQTNVNPREEISNLSSKTVLNSTFTASDLKGTEELSFRALEEERICSNDSSSQVTSVSVASASVEGSCGVVSCTEITVEAELNRTESKCCTPGGTDRLQVIQTDTLLQESNKLSCETLTVVESGELQREKSTSILKSNNDGMATNSEGKGSLPHADPVLEKDLKASETECSPQDRKDVLQEIFSEKLIHRMNNLQEIAEERTECEAVLNNSLGGEVTEELAEVNVPLITPDVETVLNASFIESPPPPPPPEEMCLENILNASFIEAEGPEEKDDAEIEISQKVASEICELRKSINDETKVVEINNVEEDGVQAAYNETFTEESLKPLSENCELEKSLNCKMIGAVDLSESDEKYAGRNSVKAACQESLTEEPTVAVQNLEGKDSREESSAEKVLNTSFMECSSVVCEHVITSENSAQVESESNGSLRDLNVPDDNETETVISGVINENSKASVEGSTSFTECDDASIDCYSTGIVNTSKSPRNIVQAETPFESSLNRTYIDNIETEENASFTVAVGQAQDVSFTECASLKEEEMLVVGSEMIKSQDTTFRELSSESCTIHYEVEENIADKSSNSKTILNITFTEELSENVIESKVNIPVPKMNSVTDVIEPQMISTLDIVESEMNTTTNIVESVMNTTIDIVESKINTTIDVVESKMNTTIDVVESKMNTTIDLVKPCMNDTLDTVESEMNSAMDVVESKINTTKEMDSESGELDSSFCVAEPLLDFTSTGPALPNKIETPRPGTSEHTTSQHCEPNTASQARVASTVPPVRQEVDVENVAKTTSESTMERIVEEPSITSDCLVHRSNELSKEASVTKIDLNSTYVTYGDPLNISDTGTEQDATFKEYSASKETEVFGHENCELQSEKSPLNVVDLNSTFVMSSDLPLQVSNSETRQNASSAMKENVENMISSEASISEGDELANDTDVAKTDLNSTFVHNNLTKETSRNVKDKKIEITQPVELSQNGMTYNLNNGSFKDNVVNEKQKKIVESFVNQCGESVSMKESNLNAGVLEDAVEVFIKKTNLNTVIEKTEASLANNLEVRKNTVIPVSNKNDNISTNLTELKSDNISASKELCPFTPAGVVDVKEPSNLLCEPFNQNPKSNQSPNPRAPVEVLNQSIPVKKDDEKKRELIEFDEVFSNFSIINLDKKDDDLNKIEKSSDDLVCASEKINVADVKNETKIQESEFVSFQMTPKNVRTSTPVNQTKELIAMGESEEAISEKNSKSGNSKKFQDSAANEFLIDIENEQFQDANLVFGDEVFKDPSTFDFLTQFGNSTSLRDLRKESLYIKFDPLVGSPRSVAATDKLSPIMNIVREEERDENKKLNITAGASDEKSEKSNGTCPKDSEGSVESFFRSKSPLLAPKDLHDDSVLRKLKEHEEECNSLKAQVAELREIIKTKDEESSSLKVQVAELQEIIKTKDEVQDDSAVHKLKEFQDECSSLTAQVAELQQLIKTKDEVHKNEVAKFESERVALEFDYAQRTEEAAKWKRDLEVIKVEKVAFDAIMNEYERTLSHIVDEKEQNCVEFSNKEMKLTKELKEWQEKCVEMERTLSGALQKLENLQNNVTKMTEREKKLMVKMKSYEKAVEIEKQKYETLKEHAAEQLESANEKLMAEEKRHQLECTKYCSSIANLELQVTNLQNLLEQKAKENDTLMGMCNDLVAQFKH